MSHLKVLTVGDNPNVLLYTWRLRQARAVDLYHVSGHKVGQKFHVSTSLYGSDYFLIQNQFESLESLKESGGGRVPFDLVILSATSLQEISSLAYQLNPMLKQDTRIFIESSGFVNLEPFVKMSIDFGDLKVFSIMTDYDFRNTGQNTFEQFNSGKKQTIYLGESGTKGKISTQKYPKDVLSILSKFQSLFQKIFPQDVVDLCNSSYLDFLSQQWKIAIPQICFDPLLILMEELKPPQLHEQILAKPLISGFVTEIITISRTMGAKLAQPYDSESELFSHWVEMNHSDAPRLVYHFINRTTPLDIDMLLLQPILIADDHGIKTPYLEFLYSMMCQFQKINNGESQWFTRTDVNDDLRSNLQALSADRNTLAVEVQDLKEYITKREKMWAEERKGHEQYHLSQLSEIKMELSKLKDDVAMERHKNTALTAQINQLKHEQNYVHSYMPMPPQMPAPPSQRAMPSKMAPPSANGSSSQTFNEQANSDSHDDDSSSGTPDMKDIAEFACYGIRYNDTPEKKSGSFSPTSSHGLESATNGDTMYQPVQSSSNSIRERDIDMRRQDGSRRVNSHSGHPPPKPLQMPHQRPSKPQMYPQPSHGMNAARNMVNHNRQMHNSISRNNSLVDPYPPQLGQPIHPHPQTFKKTDRKNRQSYMPSLRNASSTGLDDFSVPQGISRMGNQMFPSRAFSNPQQRMALQNPVMYPAKIPNMNGNPAPQHSVQRQLSTANTFCDGSSMNTIVRQALPQQKKEHVQLTTSQGNSPPRSAQSSIYGNSISVNSIAAVNTANGYDHHNGVHTSSLQVPQMNGSSTPRSSTTGSASSNHSTTPGVDTSQPNLEKIDWKQTPPSSDGSVGDRKSKFGFFARKNKDKK
ncbi:Svl3p Ecym_2533 [Eremothecium cymbalariae DBVPG|uniref:Ketopantoate reductase C-terminal domain-containing protein n=1 Tax=Eremothecium cymbalariae (strain CBS 270.75 / DBVPG 7215 / KCTC 17166 / NRRL Y-17582) TaxID=931890 RepID=G8JQ96_ERECY|nr:Hypothetical protein Ecym_2533 [Eremothecium cymbalariae DBVPG\